jgi:hypothetical protein
MAGASLVSGATDSAPGAGRVLSGMARLYDGYVPRSASDAIRHLEALTQAHPEDAEAWCRLGNACERFGEREAARRWWLKGLEVAPDHFLMRYSIAQNDVREDDWSAASLSIAQAVGAFCRWRSSEPDRVALFAQSLAELVEDMVANTYGPLGLVVAAMGGPARDLAVLDVRSADLRKVSRWDRLVEVLLDPAVLTVRLVGEVPEVETELGAWLAGTAGELHVAALRPSAPRPPRRPGRRPRGNDPCPCGSGRKLKRCCGRRD